MSNSIFMLSKYLKKTVTTALILGLMISPILPATQSISSSISIATQAAEIEVQLEEAQTEEVQASTDYWSEYINTDWYYDNQNENENEYTIATAEELAGLAYLVNKGTCAFEGKTILLGADIDLGDHEWVPIGISNGFEGTFDGRNRVIKNMKIGNSNSLAEYDYAGLFGWACDAIIRNVNIDKCSEIYASASYVGGICGTATDTQINNCTYSGTIVSNCKYLYVYTGGVCGSAEDSKISDCTNNGNISSSNISVAEDNLDYAGGICGFGENVEINNCSNSGIIESNISSESAIDVKGGICGYSIGTLAINNCINSGIIISRNKSNKEETTNSSGGICGYSEEGIINNCSNSGFITSTNTSDTNKYTLAGGIVGGNIEATIDNCINKGSVTSSGDSSDDKSPVFAGGICSYSLEKIKINNCINIGDVLSNYNTKDSTGEICGYAPENIEVTNSYYGMDTIAQGVGNKANQDGITALPTSQIKAVSGAPSEENWVDIAGFGKNPLVDVLNIQVNNYNETNPDIKASNWEIKDGEIVLKAENDNATEQDTSINTDDVIIESNISY